MPTVATEGRERGNRRFPRIRDVLSFVKIEHSVFALPFVYVGALFASNGVPAWSDLAWMTLAAVGARGAAFGFNRVIDKAVDAMNPRTARREMPRGAISTPFALGLTVAFLALFLGSAWRLNELAFRLAPAVIPFLVWYPYTKRFTWTCHFWLALPFGVAPMGGWIAATGEFPLPLEEPVPWLLAVAAGLWVAGFDILYALLDVNFDRRHRIHSVPADFSETVALRVSEALHLATWLCLGAVWYLGRAGTTYLVGWAVVGMLLMYEHVIVNPEDPRTVQKAFFTMNGITSFVVLATVLGDVLL